MVKIVVRLPSTIPTIGSPFPGRACSRLISRNPSSPTTIAGTPATQQATRKTSGLSRLEAGSYGAHPQDQAGRRLAARAGRASVTHAVIRPIGRMLRPRYDPLALHHFHVSWLKAWIEIVVHDGTCQQTRARSLTTGKRRTYSNTARWFRRGHRGCDRFAARRLFRCPAGMR